MTDRIVFGHRLIALTRKICLTEEHSGKSCCVRVAHFASLVRLPWGFVPKLVRRSPTGEGGTPYTLSRAIRRVVRRRQIALRSRGRFASLAPLVDPGTSPSDPLHAHSSNASPRSFATHLTPFAWRVSLCSPRCNFCKDSRSGVAQPIACPKVRTAAPDARAGVGPSLTLTSGL